mmetsp:Transcript_27328/g.48690  ORF Transcript_27328/g.48690 Transcript_27328/m.48690 type:complete len:240 (-) Transcript_27328:544-1263(-)
MEDLLGGVPPHCDPECETGPVRNGGRGDGQRAGLAAGARDGSHTGGAASRELDSTGDSRARRVGDGDIQGGRGSVSVAGGCATAALASKCYCGLPKEIILDSSHTRSGSVNSAHSIVTEVQVVATTPLRSVRLLSSICNQYYVECNLKLIGRVATLPYLYCQCPVLRSLVHQQPRNAYQLSVCQLCFAHMKRCSWRASSTKQTQKDRRRYSAAASKQKNSVRDLSSNEISGSESDDELK